MPEFHTAANVAAEKRFAERVWQRASGLIAVSENTRNDAVRLLGLDGKRIQVIYPGIAEVYFEVHPTEAQLVRHQYRLDRNYVLFVGTIEPRKNLITLLDAYDSLPSDIREEFELVIAGPMGWLAQLVARRLENSTSSVRYLGYIPESAMPGLFAGATVFAYVSLYEGFGFPVAQALAAGVPVLTSAISSLPEVAGGAAEMVDPGSTEEVRTALYRLLTSPSRRSSLVTAGRRRAGRFRWDTCARESMRFFERVAGRM
jgi:alpha-1,3-rhamnosyl/mannosyltransferase